MGLPRWHSGKESACQCRRCKRCRSDPWVGKIPWRRKWQHTPLFMPGEFHGQRSLAGYSPWGCKELDTTEYTYTQNSVRNGLSWWLSGKESACQCGKCEFDPWVRKIPWRRKWQPTPVLLPGKFHGQRSLVGSSPWGRKESDTTVRLHLTSRLMLLSNLDYNSTFKSNTHWVDLSLDSKASVSSRKFFSLLLLRLLALITETG